MDNLYHLLQKIKLNPYIYLGKKSLALLYAFINGYKSYEEEQSDIIPIPDCLDGFQSYVQKKYNIYTDHNWARIIDFFSNDDADAFDCFYQLLEDLLNKKSR